MTGMTARGDRKQRRMKMFNHKVGDTVRIRSKEWIDAQEKDADGDILPDGAISFTCGMYKFAGRTAKIVMVDESDSSYYALDIDGKTYNWQDYMFDPAYNPDDPLSAEDAIRAMLDGETLYDEDEWDCFWDKDTKDFYYRKNADTIISVSHTHFTNLRRRPVKRTRPMTRWEMIAWANSEESRGWVVKTDGDIAWYPPQFYGYTGILAEFQRARLLPDHSGIDENTIQGFEVEVKE
jgi:hypothetical protein